ncbi:unnamed protein product [Cuscuta epithymum]|uniref:Pollen Ole e 1 allergen and extensin family protein n=1 Tax=Cuscuta epithymum TaxID=186058 RepID=A0AAV0D1H0_9ASTE|nr:unnamed protein product [Cuscuta epithymum]
MAAAAFIFVCSFFYFFASSSPMPIHGAHSTVPQITVMGMVYCDICSNNSFSPHSYFIPGVEVRIDCTFKASSPKTAEQIVFSVNRTTNRLGIYKLEIPTVDGIECAREKEMGNFCRASLIVQKGPSSSSSSSPSAACNLPASTTTTEEVAIKSITANTCIYSLSALTFRPSTRNVALCGSSAN